ncbi:hypothetical protein QR680_013442 [Steinernema hermaphroditum]|uniref:28S ribosomal protein S18a, mitochondrial n=1 Tax=Steinernema hermaphroditum TaxID=289476 RepID=A0AA39I8B6_9BILA|nr:hypothetical protein QR680_013442 [Steinernema hermaphroditum]
MHCFFNSEALLPPPDYSSPSGRRALKRRPRRRLILKLRVMAGGRLLNFVLSMFFVLPLLGASADVAVFVPRLELMNVTVFDNSRPEESLRITVSGSFHHYGAVKKAILALSKRHLDWCGFALRLDTDGISRSWTKDQRAEFHEKLNDFSCADLGKQGFYSEKRPIPKMEVVYKDGTYVIVGLSLAFSNLFIIFVFVAVAFLIKRCRLPRKMLSLHFRNSLKTAVRQISSTASLFAKEIKETVEGDTTVVEVVDVPSADSKPVLASDQNACSLCTCNLPVQISYRDVLILEQFMRADGTVLPRQHTGLCHKQQLKVERCVMQAHWAGLFPDRTIPNFDRAGYKRFNRYWENDMSMYQLKQKTEPGTWYYIKRYNSKGNGTYAKNTAN